MSEVKLVIGGRNFTVSCNPGEEADVSESAKLINIEAEEIQAQLGRLAVDKMLLLSGLMLGDKFRTLQIEIENLKSELSEKVSNSPSFNPIPQKDLNEPKERSHETFLLKISEMLESIVKNFDGTEKKEKEGPKEIIDHSQKSFL